MQRTRKEAIDEFLAHTGERGDPKARDLAERALNRVIEAIWLRHPWVDYQSPSPLELTLVPQQRSYALPDYFGRVGPGDVRNLTRGRRLLPTTRKRLDEEMPHQGTSFEVQGVPSRWLLEGTVGVETQPTTPTTLEAVSSDTSDVDVRVMVQGDDQDGRWNRTEVVLNGTTPMSLGVWSYVDSFSKGYSGTPPTEGTTSRGTVTLRLAGGGATMQVLRPFESAKEHRVFTVVPVPLYADVLAIPVLRRPKRLMLDSDPVPGDWWPAIFRGMVLQHRDNSGEMTVFPEGNLRQVWPELVTLLEHDNRQAPRRVVRPWGGQ